MESILIKVSSKNVDRKLFIFLKGSKQVQIRSMKLYGDNIGRFFKIPWHLTKEKKVIFVSFFDP